MKKAYIRFVEEASRLGSFTRILVKAWILPDLAQKSSGNLGRALPVQAAGALKTGTKRPTRRGQAA
jgi:hypothetical protein